MGRLMRRSVVRSWEPCAGVSGNRDTLHPVSSSRLQEFKLTTTDGDPWTPCRSRGKPLSHDGTPPLAPSSEDWGAAFKPNEKEQLLLDLLGINSCYGPELVLGFATGPGHAEGQRFLCAMTVHPRWAKSGKPLYEPGSVGQRPDPRCSAPRYSTDHLQTECPIILATARVQIARRCRASVPSSSCSRTR